MRGRAAITRLVLAAAALGLCAPAALGERRILLAGDIGAVWLAFKDPDDGSWQLSVRTPGAADWEDPRPAHVGALKALAAAGDGAVLFFGDGSLVRHFPDQESGHVGVKPGPDLWSPVDELLAACPGGGLPRAVLVLVRRLASGTARATRPATAPSRPVAATTRPASGPTSRPASLLATGIWELALLRYAGQRWDELAILPAWEKDLAAASIAVYGGAVYVLLNGEQPALLALSEGRWRAVDLPAEVDAAAGRLVALTEGLVLTTFNPKTGAVTICLLVRGKWSKPRPVRIGDDAAPWKGLPGPAITRFGNKLAFAWLEGQELFFGQCGLDGSGTREPLKVFERATLGLGRWVRDVFFWVVLGLLLGLMIWPGQSLRTGPFVLPEGMLPAPLAKRALAFGIDLLPFMVVFLGFMVGGWREISQAFTSLLQWDVPEAFLFAMGGYAIYSFIMETLFGATLGKMAMRLRVVGNGGRKPTLREIALRNVSKIPDIVFPPLLIFLVLTRYRQRLGDKIAWTAVIDATYVPLPPTPTPEPKDDSAQAGDDDEERPSPP